MLIKHFYPLMATDYYQYVDAIELRDKLMEGAIFLLLLSTLFKENIFSKSINAGLCIIVLGSIIDKFLQGNNDRHIHDIIVVGCAIFVSHAIYKKWNQKKI